MRPNQFVEFFGREKASAILRTDSQAKAVKAMDAALRGGFRIIEFTLTIPGAFELIREYSRRADVVVGAGTVLNAEQAQLATESGARFLVSPVVDPAVIMAAKELDVACMPGTHTPTEMLLAHDTGAQLCKLFPAPHGGPAWVRSVLGPLPFLKIVPTNGVGHRNAGEWLQAGAFALGFVAPLFEPGFLAGERWDDIESRARECLAAVRD